MVSTAKMPAQLDCNRLVKENNENREYKKHMKKLESIRQKSTSRLNHGNEDVRLPDINKKKYQNEIDFYDKENNNIRMYNNSNSTSSSNYTYTYNVQNIVNNNSKKMLIQSYWNPVYEQQKNRNPLKANQLAQIENENKRMKNRLSNIKPSIDVKKMDKDFEQHQAMLKMTSKAYYTPRGIGHRKMIDINALPDVKPFNNKKKRNAVTMLNEAVNQHERADVVLIKTMLSLNYYERMETKRKYEETYNSELKKGLLKVMPKEYEPLIVAILTDKDLNDVDRIYEALYDPNEAAVVITEAIISRDLNEKNLLLQAFKQKIQYELKHEIKNKIPEGELQNILFSLLENENDNFKVDYDKAKSDAEELKTMDEIPLNCDVLLNAIKSDSKAQIKALFEQHQNDTGIDICSKMETNKPVGKVIKVIQSCLTSSALFNAEKLQKTIKQNETEFIRLLSIFPKDDMKSIEMEYKKKFKTRLNDDITSNFSDEISRLVLHILNPASAIDIR